MNHFRATNTETNEVVEYDADLPQDAHRSPPWRLEQLFDAPPTPDQPPAPPPTWRITKLAFLNRFTDQEAIGIDMASQGTDVQAAMLRRYLDKIRVAENVNTGDAVTRTGVGMLEQAGLIAAGRASAILDTPPTAEEAWNG